MTIDNNDMVWLSYHLYVGRHYELMDELLTGAVTQLRKAYGQHGSFFIRFVDEGGPHVRIRFRVPLAEQKDVDREVMVAATRDLDRLSSLPPSLYVPLVRYEQQAEPFIFSESWDAPVEIRRKAYEPEWDVYGDRGAGMDISEQLFDVSSDLAQEVLALEKAGLPNLRKTLATALADQVLAVLVPERERDEFLNFYASYWLAATSLEGTIQERSRQKIDELRAAGIAVIADPAQLDPRAAAIISRWEESLKSTVRRYQTETQVFNASQMQKLRFNYLHLMNNRLGINALEEGYLATLMHFDNSRVDL